MTNSYLIMKILILIATLFSCIYGFRQLQKGLNNKYFLICLYGMLAILLSRIYYLSLVLSNGKDTVFTIGTLGQASAYLFFILANTKYLSMEFNKKINNRIYVPAILGFIIVGFIFILTAIKIGTLSSYICEIIYLISMGSAFYVSINVIHSRKNIKECSYVTPFNICTSLLTLLNAIFGLTRAYVVSNHIVLIYWVQTLISVIVVSLMMIILKKGVKSWKQ